VYNTAWDVVLVELEVLVVLVDAKYLELLDDLELRNLNLLDFQAVALEGQLVLR